MSDTTRATRPSRELVREFFADAAVIETVENTYRPSLNGTRRRVTKVGASYFDAIVLDGEQAGQDCRGVIPTRLGDVVSLGDGAITIKLAGPKGPPRLVGHTVTYRKLRR